MTDLVNRSLAGDEDASERVFGQLWRELRSMAARRLSNERDEHSWQPSDLANECLVRLLGAKQAFASREHFFAAVAKMMQHLLVDHARRRNAQKRPDSRERTPLDSCHARVADAGLELIDVADALDQLDALAPRQAQVLRLRHFADMTWREIGGAIQCSESQARKDAANGEAFLRRQLKGFS